MDVESKYYPSMSSKLIMLIMAFILSGVSPCLSENRRWGDINSSVVNCVRQNLSVPLEEVVAQGIGPDDPSIQHYVADCERKIASSARGSAKVNGDEITDKLSPLQRQFYDWSIFGFSVLLCVFVVRPPMMRWYRGQARFYSGSGSVQIMLRQIGDRIGMEVFALFISFIVVFFVIRAIIARLN